MATRKKEPTKKTRQKETSESETPSVQIEASDEINSLDLEINHLDKASESYGTYRYRNLTLYLYQNLLHLSGSNPNQV